MKKVLIALPFLALGFAISVPTTQSMIVKAEAPISEPSASSEEPTSSQPSSSEITEEGAVETVKNWMSKYLDEQLVLAIINWAIDVGLLSALFGVYLKFRKYKSMSSKEIASEVKQTIESEVSKSVEKLTAEQIQGLVDKMSAVETGLETTNKILIFANDKTAEGKKALLELLSLKVNDEATKKLAEEEKKKIEQEQKAKEEAKEKVEEDYKGIF